MKECQIYCNVTACVKGAIEYTVESIGSKLEHHNMAGQHNYTSPIMKKGLWHGMALKFNTVIMPDEEHLTNILVYGKEWHFTTARVVKVHTIPQAVDSIQRMPPNRVFSDRLYSVQ